VGFLVFVFGGSLWVGWVNIYRSIEVSSSYMNKRDVGKPCSADPKKLMNNQVEWKLNFTKSQKTRKKLPKKAKIQKRKMRFFSHFPHENFIFTFNWTEEKICRHFLIFPLIFYFFQHGSFIYFLSSDLGEKIFQISILKFSLFFVFLVDFSLYFSYRNDKRSLEGFLVNQKISLFK
jgi:hypothetical protein